MIKVKLLCILLIAALLMPAIGEASNPTVLVTGYQIDPEVLMPGDIGTIKVTIANTATTATLVETNTYSGLTTTTTVPISANIQSAYLYGGDIEVLSGKSMTITFAVKAPIKDGLYFPEVWIDVQGGRNTKYSIPVKVDSASVSLAASDMPLVILKDDTSEVKLTIANKRPNNSNGRWH